MKTTRILAILVLTLASTTYGAQSLTVNSDQCDSIMLELGESCTIEVISDDNSPYVDYIGFDNKIVLGNFLYTETKPENGDQNNITDYNVPAFFGYRIKAASLISPPSAGVHFVFQYEALQVGETDVKLYQNNPPPLPGTLLDSVHITIIPIQPKPIGTAFTYQGRLLDDNKPADGLYDLQFKLYDSPADGNQQGSTIDVNEVDVINGYFTVELDFGSVFESDARWLEIGIRLGDLNDPNAYKTLSPRKEMKPMPYVIYAKAREYLRTNLPGHALVECVRARTYLDPNDKQDPIQFNVMTALRDSMAYTIIIPPLDAEESADKAKVLLRTELIGSIHQARPELCEILLMDETGRGPSGQVPQFHLQITMFGLEVELVKNSEYEPLSQKVDRLAKEFQRYETKFEDLETKVSSTDERIAELQARDEKLLNDQADFINREHPRLDDPRYVRFEAQIREGRNELRRLYDLLKNLKREKDSIEADLENKRYDLQRARQDFEGTSPEMLTCTGSVALQLSDPEGRLLFSKVFNETVSLPSNKGAEKVTRETISALVGLVSPSLKDLFGAVSNIHLMNARKLDKGGNSKAALEEYVKYLISGISQDEQGFLEAKTAIKRMTGVSMSVPMQGNIGEVGDQQQKINAVRI